MAKDYEFEALKSRATNFLIGRGVLLEGATELTIKFSGSDMEVRLTELLAEFLKAERVGPITAGDIINSDSFEPVKRELRVVLSLAKKSEAAVRKLKSHLR